MLLGLRYVGLFSLEEYGFVATQNQFYQCALYNYNSIGSNEKEHAIVDAMICNLGIFGILSYN